MREISITVIRFLFNKLEYKKKIYLNCSKLFDDKKLVFDMVIYQNYKINNPAKFYPSGELVIRPSLIWFGRTRFSVG